MLDNIKLDKKIFQRLLLGFILVIASMTIIYCFSVGNPLSGENSGLGTLGDFIGGLLNPAMTFITIIFLIHTIAQNQKIIEQGNNVIKLNTQELEDTRKELTQTKEAHQESTRLEKIDLERKIISRNEDLYIQELVTLRGEINDLLNMNIVALRDNIKKTNFNSFTNSYDEFILSDHFDNFYSEQILLEIIDKAITLCSKIGDEKLLKNNPNEFEISNIQKSLSSVMLKNLTILINDISKSDPEADYPYITSLKEDTVFNEQVEMFKEAYYSKNLHFTILPPLNSIKTELETML